jgi:Icc-related predicted phosphoesterase
MTETIRRVQPRLMVCGHIHPAYGRYQLGETEIINASLVDNQYRPVNRVVTLEVTLR